MIRVDMTHFVPGSQVHHLGAHVHRARNERDQLVEGARLVRPDVENLVPRAGRSTDSAIRGGTSWTKLNARFCVPVAKIVIGNFEESDS